MAFGCVRGRDGGGTKGDMERKKKERERCVCRLRKKQTGKREGGRASAGLAKRHSVKLTAII